MIPALLFLVAASAAEPRPVVELPAHDHSRLLRADIARRERGEPVRYAVPQPISRLWVDGLDTAGGRWRAEGAERLVWEARIRAAGASSVDLGLFDFWLPQGASLIVTDATGTVRRGPFTDAHNRAHGQLWTPIVPGEEARLELRVPVALAPHVRFRVRQVNYGYRFFNAEAVAKAEPCNVDVACPAGDPYRDIIRSAAMYTNGAGAGICSGALINTTAGPAAPYFLTARHCGISEAQAPSLVFYFNYESPECRPEEESGQVLPRSLADTVSGARLVAQNGVSDFLLLELEETPPAEALVHYAGWDRRNVAPTMGVSIHHPRTHEKRLAIENEPLVTGTDTLNFFNPPLAPGSYWEVREWDVGITETGSSGSPLFDAAKRIVGQLAGGAAFTCPGAEEGSDWYGKLSLSWDAGASPEARLADWLDPVGTGALAIDGADDCGAALSATASSELVGVGERVTFSADATGGTPPYRYEWDLDGDGTVDSRLAAPEASYPTPPGEDGRVDARVAVIDAAGCRSTTSVGLVVEAPTLALEAQPLVEQCGDGDDRVERGEVWAFPLTFKNDGTRSAVDAVAAFTNGARIPDVVTRTDPAKAIAGPDAFGYTARDSEELFCTYTDVDLTDAADVTPAFTDDAATRIALGGDASTGLPPFRFYGEALDAVAFSTNGYLATDADEAGDDFSNDCPLPAAPDRGAAGRIMPLHDDLVVTGALRHAFYQVCPRPADVGGPDQACEAFEWSDMRYFAADASFDVQAFLYPETDALAFQYRGNDPQRGASATIGIQDPAASRALTFACDTPDVIAPGRAVCLYSPAEQPPVLSPEAELLAPVLRLGTVAPGESVSASVAVRITEDVPCGAALVVRYLGTVHGDGFSPPPDDALLLGQVADGEGCSAGAVDICPRPSPPDFVPRSGFWLAPGRPGNGLDLHFSGGETGLYGAWYTARPDGDRAPTWYYLQTLAGQRLVEDQISAEILAFSGPVDTLPTFRVAGAAVLSFLGPERAFLAWELDGEAGGELVEFLDFGGGIPPVESATDQFFAPSEPGWGVAQQLQGDEAFAVVYLYDESGQPSWIATSGQGATLKALGQAPVSLFSTHCPGCVWTTTVPFEAGTLELDLDPGAATGVLSIDLLLDAPVGLDWRRTGLPVRSIQSIIDPDSP